MGAAAVLALGAVVAGVSSLSGHVVDGAGSPVAGARVFTETGLGAVLLETVASPDGAWRFEGLGSGQTGVFAISDGLAFGGQTVTAGGDVSGQTIRLENAASLHGKVVDARGRPIQGARVTRVALLGAAKVGIPLAKLRAFGFDEPVSDEEGRFVIPRLPEGGTVALKIAHPAYAQEAVSGVAVGGTVEVTLHEGVFVEGDVLSREGHLPVVDVTVMVRNAQPPHDTVVTKTDVTGAFAMRLKPGVYSCQAVTSQVRSPGWQGLTVTGEGPVPRLRLHVAGVGRIRGKLCDAVTGEPISGAKVRLDTEGHMAAVARSAPSGEFVLSAMAGDNVVRLDSAPGYRAPEQPALRVQVAEGGERALPTFWLAPIPTHLVRVIDPHERPAPGVGVTVLWPQQFGWRRTDPEGRVRLEFASLPPNGAIVGLAEHTTQPLGALFALERDDPEEALVKLFPLGAVRGRVVDPKGMPVEGAVVAGLLGKDGLPVWRTTTGTDGTFMWPAVVPNVEHHCVVSMGQAEPRPAGAFSVEPAGQKDLGDLVFEGRGGGASWRGKTLLWHRNRLLAGTLPGRRERKGRPAVVAYCQPDEAAMVIEGLVAAHKLVADERLLLAVVVNGGTAAEGAPIPVLSGQAPATATTYLVGGDGKVVLETFGLPPLVTLRRLLFGPV